MTMSSRELIGLNEGWEFLHKGIVRLTRIIEGEPEEEFSAADYMFLFTTVYNMCTQKPPHDYSQQLYDRYVLTIKEYILLKVLPFLREKHGQILLEEFVRSWLNHKVLVNRLSEIFHYLDRYFAARRCLPNLRDAGLTIYRDLVYHEMKDGVRDIVICLINSERTGEQINQHLIKNAVNIFLEIGDGSMEFYENDFEAAFLDNSVSYYTQKAINWIMVDSCVGNMQMLEVDDSLKEKDWVMIDSAFYTHKLQDCLKHEENHVLFYLHSSTEKKLLEKVQTTLLSVRD